MQFILFHIPIEQNAEDDGDDGDVMVESLRRIELWFESTEPNV